MTAEAGAGAPVVVTVRPDVPMQMYTCLPAVLATGVARALLADGVDDVAVSWPSSISVGGEPAARVDARAGYDEGLYATCEVVPLAGATPLAGREGLVGRAISDAADAWERDLRTARVVAGPLAPVLQEYFDLLDCANADVEVVYPNGRVAARGVLAGMDVWGRASVVTYGGREVVVSPEQASIRPAGRA